MVQELFQVIRKSGRSTSACNGLDSSLSQAYISLKFESYKKTKTKKTTVQAQADS